MRLGEPVEWALHCATVLALLPADAALPASKLAEFHGVPAAYLAKSLQSLSRAGIVESVPGRNGGYRLGRPPAEVTAVARSEAKAAWVRSVGAAPVNVDLFDPAGVKGAVAGHDVVCNLATHIPPTAKMVLPGAWDENNRIRREVSRNLVDAALAAGAERYIQEAVCFLY